MGSLSKVMFSLALILSVHDAYGQQSKLGDIPALQVKTKTFLFSNNNPRSQDFTSILCPGSDEQFGDIISAKPTQSNAQSQVHVTTIGPPSKSFKCIVLTVTMPPSIQQCVMVPAPNWSEPSRTRQECSSSFPTNLAVEVQYQSKPFEAPTGFVMTSEPSTDRRGDDYFDIGIDALTICQELCLRDEACKAYTFVPSGFTHKDWNGPTPHCWLKSNQPKATPWDGLTSGIKLPVS